MDVVVVLAFILAAVLLAAAVALVAWGLWPRHSIGDEAEAWLKRNSPHGSALP